MHYADVYSPLNGFPGEQPSIAAAPRLPDITTAEKLAAYFDSGCRIVQALGYSIDAFGSGRRTSLDVMTDGTWVWPSSAGFYCMQYLICPPYPFIEVVLAAESPPSLSAAEALEALRGFRVDAALVHMRSS